jgi:polysaccharide biosynthesis protein PelG
MSTVNITLERMTRHQGLSFVAAVYVYSALLVAGPWIFTVIGLFGLGSASCLSACLNQPVFRSVIIYNSMFSLIFTSPLAFLCARHVSDQVHSRQTDGVMYTLLVALACLFALVLTITAPFYAVATSLTALEKIACIQNATLICCAWLLVPFVGTLQKNHAVLVGFGGSAGIFIAAGHILDDPSLLTLILIFNACFTAINVILIAVMIRHFGKKIRPDAGLITSIKELWQLPVAGLAYALGLWIDKVIMWLFESDGRMELAGALWTMPLYDTPMFWAQLASIPIMAVFFVHVKTNFSKIFQQFYGRLNKQASLRQLAAAMQKLRIFVISQIVAMFVALTIVAALTILIAFVFMSELGLRPTYMSILRIALVAMVFHTSAMFCFMFLLHFDLRSQALVVVTAFAVLNAVLTIAFLPAGPAFYGYGNMIASALTFLLAFSLVLKELSWLHYHAFVTNNKSVTTG